MGSSERNLEHLIGGEKISIMKRILPVIFLFTICAKLSFAQQGIYIPADGKVCLTGVLPVSFYQDTKNDGFLATNSGATLWFFGKQWTNGTAATLNNGSGKGGIFRFAGNNPLNTTIGRQLLYGGYNTASSSGASFPNLTVDNSDGIELGDLNDTKVRTNLHFNSGHIYLNGWNLVVGDGDPGSITGYSDKSYVVTGSGTAGGYLYREKMNAAAGKVVFPIGTNAASYSPVSVDYSGTDDDIRARVFDNVFQQAITGAAFLDTFLYKTWNIGTRNGGTSSATLTFQHKDSEEQAAYAANRNNSVLNRYTNNKWGEMPFQQLAITGGDLTSPGLQGNTMHTQQGVANIGKEEYFSKSTRNVTPGKQVLFVRFYAERISWEHVETFFTTQQERNVNYFVLERRFENQTSFSTAAQMPSKGVNGNSRGTLNYYYLDKNDFDGWTYYRVKVVLRDGSIEYSEIRAVPPMKKIEIFPNPNYGNFKVRVRGYRAPMILHITNVWGQVVRQYRVQSEGVIDITNIAAATYFVVLYEEGTNAVTYRGKVIVLK